MGKFVVNNDVLRAGLKTVAPAVAKNNVIPAMDCIKFSVWANKLKLTASDYNVYIEDVIPCEAKEKFEFIVAADLILRIAEVMNGPVWFTLEGPKLTISCENDVFNLTLEDINSYPNTPIAEQAKQALITDGLIEAISNAAKTVKKESLGAVVEYVLLEVCKDEICVVSTDTNCLFRQRFKINNASPANLLIHPRIATSLAGAGKLEGISYTNNHVFFDFGDTRVITRQTEGRYPDYRGVFPQGDVNCKIEIIQLLSGLKKASITANKLTNLLCFDITKEYIEISSTDTDMGYSGQCVVPFENNNVPVERLGVNARILQTSLQQIQGAGFKEVNGFISSPTRAIVLSSEQKEVEVLVMPIMLLN